MWARCLIDQSVAVFQTSRDTPILTHTRGHQAHNQLWALSVPVPKHAHHARLWTGEGYDTKKKNHILVNRSNFITLALPHRDYEDPDGILTTSTKKISLCFHTHHCGGYYSLLRPRKTHLT